LTINQNLIVDGTSYLNEVDVSGNLTINSDLTVEGTSYLNDVDVSGSIIFSNQETIDTSGSIISLNQTITLIDCSGTSMSIILPNETYIGKIKIIILQSNGGSNTCVVNGTYLPSFTTATFDNVGDSLTLLSMGSSGWTVLANNSSALA